MKKLIAVLMAIAILLSLCACGSSSTPPKKDIDDITADDIQAAVDKMMGVEEETAAPAQASNDAPTPDDYIVCVEMTPENFGDYFEPTILPVLDDWGEPTGKYTYGFISKVYDQGLQYVSAIDKAPEDFLVEIEIKEDSYSPRTSTLPNGSFDALLRFMQPTYNTENITVSVTRVKGHLNFLKTEYIDHETLDSTKRQNGYDLNWYSVYMKDGSVYNLYCLDGMRF